MIPKILFLFTLVIIPFIIDAKKFKFEESEQYLRKYEHIPKYNHEFKKNYVKQKYHKKEYNEKRADFVPPDHTKLIAMARFVVHQADWTSVATLSTIEAIRGFPFANIVSMSDGPVDNSTGIPYFYLTPLDFTSKDLQKDNRCTISVSLEESDYCSQQNIDPEDPRCARVMLSGKMKKVQNSTGEYEFAKTALFSRHPSMATLPADHHFYFAKLKISQIALLDWFGGPKYIGVREYLTYKPEKNMDTISLAENNNIDENFSVINV